VLARDSCARSSATDAQNLLLHRPRTRSGSPSRRTQVGPRRWWRACSPTDVDQQSEQCARCASSPGAAAGEGRAGRPRSPEREEERGDGVGVRHVFRGETLRETTGVASLGAVLSAWRMALRMRFNGPRRRVPREVEPLGDVTFREVIERTAAGHLQPLDAARHDGGERSRLRTRCAHRGSVPATDGGFAQDVFGGPRRARPECDAAVAEEGRVRVHDRVDEDAPRPGLDPGEVCSPRASPARSHFRSRSGGRPRASPRRRVAPRPSDIHSRRKACSTVSRRGFRQLRVRGTCVSRRSHGVGCVSKGGADQDAEPTALPQCVRDTTTQTPPGIGQGWG